MTDTVRGLLDAGAGDEPAVLAADGSALTHAQLRAEVDGLAERLRSFGLGAGDRVALVLPNGPEMAVAFLAAAAHCCAAPLNPKYRTGELSFYLEDLGAAALITRPDETGAAARAAAAQSKSPVLSLSLTSADDAPRPSRLQLTAADPADPHPADPADPDPADPADPDPANPTAPATAFATGRRPGPDDVALVLHTSGTTSRPKIVPLRQRHLARSAAAFVEWLSLTPADRSLNVMPLFHIHGLMAGLLAPLAAGGSVACTPGFDAFAFFGWLRSLRPTYYTAVPTMHQMAIARSGRHRAAARASGLRFVRSSSAGLPAPVLAELADLFGVPVIEAYSMTEAAHQMCSNPLPPGVAKPRSVGLPAGVAVAVLDPDGRRLPAGERGEVAIRGPSVIDGYENNPSADAAAFTDGWFRTGDEGCLDGDGYLFLTGRLKEQINRGGEKVSPQEVDEALLGHPAVAEAVTFAVPHDKLGEQVAAAVVVCDGASVTEAELRRYLSGSLAAFKVPRRVLLLDELPKGPTGKLQRLGLASRLGLAADPARPPSSLA